jgi:hypothetical protein
MDRRLLITALAAFAGGRAPAQESIARPRHKISMDALHDAVSARFPVRLGVPGLLQVQVATPRLFPMPARNRLGASLHAVVSAPEVQQVQAGELDVAFALRYEGADRSVRAHSLEVLELRWPGLPAETLRTLQRLLPLLAREAVGEVVVHRFSAREIGLAETMGFEPDAITVVNDGVLITFRPR